MAVIVYDPSVDPILDSRQGVTFSLSQAGATARRRSSPINHQTDDRQTNRVILSTVGKFFWAMDNVQKGAWMGWANDNGMVKPFPLGPYQLANAAFLSLQVNSFTAGDALYIPPPGDIPITGVTFSALARIDQDTIRATFAPSPAGADLRIYLRQGIPGPGFKNLDQVDGYIAQYSQLNPNSTFDFTTKFQHLAGWNCRYWVGTQDDTGRRAVEQIFDL